MKYSFKGLWNSHKLIFCFNWRNASIWWRTKKRRGKKGLVQLTAPQLHISRLMPKHRMGFLRFSGFLTPSKNMLHVNEWAVVCVNGAPYTDRLAYSRLHPSNPRIGSGSTRNLIRMLWFLKMDDDPIVWRSEFVNGRESKSVWVQLFCYAPQASAW